MGRRVPQVIHAAQGLALLLSCALACGRRAEQAPSRSAPLETGIARALTETLGVPVTTRCVIVADVAVCRAWAGGVALPIAVENHRGAWTWEVEGRFVNTGPIVARIAGELADLGVHETVDCGAPVARIDDRLACSLSGGGRAFVTVAPDGRVDLELAIDPAAAGVRSEQPADLTTMSRGLETSGGDEDEEGGTVAP